MSQTQRDGAQETEEGGRTYREWGDSGGCEGDREKNLGAGRLREKREREGKKEEEGGEEEENREKVLGGEKREGGKREKLEAEKGRRQRRKEMGDGFRATDPCRDHRAQGPVSMPVTTNTQDKEHPGPDSRRKPVPS